MERLLSEYIRAESIMSGTSKHLSKESLFQLSPKSLTLNRFSDGHVLEEIHTTRQGRFHWGWKD